MSNTTKSPEGIIVQTVVLAVVLALAISVVGGAIIGGLTAVGLADYTTGTVGLFVGLAGIAAGVGAFFGILTFWYYRRSVAADRAIERPDP